MSVVRRPVSMSKTFSDPTASVKLLINGRTEGPSAVTTWIHPLTSLGELPIIIKGQELGRVPVILRIQETWAWRETWL